jgi:PAS domain S-box-containing protein
MNAKPCSATSHPLEPDPAQGFRTLARWRQALLREATPAGCGQRIVDLAAEATGADTAVLVLGDGAGRGRIGAARGLDVGLAATFSVPLDENLEAALAAGLPAGPGGQWLAVPLRDRAGLAGLLAVGFARGVAAEPDASALLEALADQAAALLARLGASAGVPAERESGGEPAAPAGQQGLMKLLESLGVGLWRMEFSDQSIHWQAASRRLWYVGPDEPLTLDLFWSRLHPEDREATDSAYRAALRDHTAYTVEQRVYDPATGDMRWVRSIGQVAYSADGTPLRLEGISLDITDLRRSEDQVRRLNRDLRRRIGDLKTILHTVPIGLAIAGEGGASHIRGNPAGERMLGLQRGSELSKSAPVPVPYRVFQEGRELPAEELPVQRAARGETVSGQVLEVERTDGQRIVVYCNAAPRWDDSGRPRGAVGAFLDITPLKRAEAALKDSEEKFRVAFATAAIGFGLAAPDGRFVDANAALARIVGYTVEELRGLDYQRLIHPEDLAGNANLIALMLEGQVPGFIAENRAIRKGGQTVWVRESVSLVRDHEGAPRWMTVLVEDITERKRAERERELASQRRKMEELLRYSVAIQTAAAIAHDLHQPLTAIASYAEVARFLADSPNPDGERLRYVLDSMGQQAQRAGQVMRQLLDLLHKGEAASERVDIRGTLDDALCILLEDGELGSLTVELEIDDDLPLVQANQLQVEKVLINLLRNGADSMREQGLADARLRVRAHWREGDQPSVQVTVSDSGKGLEASALETIFRPFYTTKAKGLGMGLAVSRALIEAYGGKLWAEPNPGGGASFHFSLPVAP